MCSKIQRNSEFHFNWNISLNAVTPPTCKRAQNEFEQLRSIVHVHITTSVFISAKILTLLI